MNKKLLFGIGLAVVIIVLIVIFGGHGSNSNITTLPQSNNQTTSSSTTLKVFTLADVAQHADAQSCYTIVNGNVYDVTAFLPQHPGGEGAILGICGKDGTTAFEMKHGDNQRAQTTLDSMRIGSLQ